MHTDKKEIQRYLGYQGIAKADENVLMLIDECTDILEKNITPRHICRTFPLQLEKDPDGADILCFGGITVKSNDLARHVRGCSKIVMMAATLGPSPDRLIARAEMTMVLKALVFQAAGAAMIESYCDEVCRGIKEEAAACELEATERFSPGYGDLSLEYQKDFERILEMKKNLGVGFTDSLLMTPSKTVTAFVGLYGKNNR